MGQPKITLGVKAHRWAGGLSGALRFLPAVAAPQALQAGRRNRSGGNNAAGWRLRPRPRMFNPSDRPLSAFVPFPPFPRFAPSETENRDMSGRRQQASLPASIQIDRRKTAEPRGIDLALVRRDKLTRAEQLRGRHVHQVERSAAGL